VKSGHKHSLIDGLLRKLFPNDAPWQRRKKFKSLLLAGLIGVVLGGLILLFAWLQNKKQGGS
jgi:hypothetical protein